MSKAHTQLPLVNEDDFIRDASGNLVAVIDWDSTQQVREDRAALIVRAVNSHEAMKEALNALIAVVGLTAFKYEGQRAVLQEAVDQARAALALAKEGE